MRGQLFVISGPSGAGKSSIARALLDGVPGLAYSVSHTSRRPRGAEKDGVDYHFVDRGTFREMIAAGAFVEWAPVYDDYYGTAFSTLKERMDAGLDVLLDVDSQGARGIREAFDDTALIYVLPPSLSALEKRLTARGTDSERTIRRRMEKAAREIENCLWYDYIVINDVLETAVREARSIIVSRRCRTSRRKRYVRERFGIPASGKGSGEGGDS